MLTANRIWNCTLLSYLDSGFDCVSAALHLLIPRSPPDSDFGSFELLCGFTMAAHWIFGQEGGALGHLGYPRNLVD